MMSNEKKEKRILFLSFWAGLLFAISEFIFAIYSHSQSALMDAAYDASELIFIILILFLTPLFHKPISEKRPYGFFQVESIFLIIKGFMLLSVTLSVSANVVTSALSGGNPIDGREVSIFQLVLGLASIVVFVIIRKSNQSASSLTIKGELLGWKMDIAYSFGMALAFFLSTFLAKTPFAFITPYFDQLVALFIVIFMLPENIKMLWSAIKDVFLFSPNEDTVNEIKEICQRTLDANHFKANFFDITRTGRHLWVAVYFEISEDALSVQKLQAASELVNRELTLSFENCICELILIP